LGKILLRSKNIILNVPYGYWDPPKTIIARSRAEDAGAAAAAEAGGSRLVAISGAEHVIAVEAEATSAVSPASW
jgi:hypothetical protein